MSSASAVYSSYSSRSTSHSGVQSAAQSTVSADAPGRRSSRRGATRGGSCRAPRRGRRRRGLLPLPRTLRVVAASSGVNGRVCRLVMMLSRPKTAMDHGSPAAGIEPPGRSTDRLQRGGIDDAALIGLDEREPVRSHVRRPARACVPTARAAPSYPVAQLVLPGAASTMRIDTSINADHRPCASSMSRKRSTASSSYAPGRVMHVSRTNLRGGSRE